MKNTFKFDAASILGGFLVMLVLAGVAGWVMNIVEIFSTGDVPVTTLFVIRCVGVFFPPIGAVVGYI